MGWPFEGMYSHTASRVRQPSRKQTRADIGYKLGEKKSSTMQISGWVLVSTHEQMVCLPHTLLRLQAKVSDVHVVF